MLDCVVPCAKSSSWHLRGEALRGASPLFNQFVIDEVIVSGDRELLTVLWLSVLLPLIRKPPLASTLLVLPVRWSGSWLVVGGRVFARSSTAYTIL